MVTLDPKRVRESLQRLCAVKTDIFGAIGHRFLLNPTLTEADVSAFEQRHKVRLPADYRHFITAIGNGGAGPYYGVFPLGRWDGVGRGLESWREAEGFIGILSEPFLLTDKWNDLQRKPPDELLQTDEQEYEKQYDEFERRYWHSSRMNGAIPICHEGCALRIWLVLTGEQAGRLWRDGRADCTGLTPLQSTDGSPATFSRWYGEWLENVLQQARLVDRQMR